jgi:hypothetical protein
LPQGVFSRLLHSESLLEILPNEPCLHFGPWGVLELIWGKTIRFYGKISKNWEKMHNDFIAISILNPDKSS